MKLLLTLALMCAVSLGCFDRRRAKATLERIESGKSEYDCDHRATKPFVNNHGELFQFVKNEHGVVTPQDLAEKLNQFVTDNGKQEFNISPKIAIEMISEGDVNADGVLTEKEWIKMFVKKASEKYKPETEDTFALFDRDRNNKVTEAELVTVLSRVPDVTNPKLVARMIMEEYECDGDKSLNIEEFLGFIVFGHKESDKSDEMDESNE